MHFVVYISHLFARSLASLASPAAPPPTTPPASYNLFAPAAAFKPVHTATHQAHTPKKKSTVRWVAARTTSEMA